MDEPNNDVAKLLERLDAYRDRQGARASGNGVSNVNINAGGFGIWVCVTATVVCVVLMVVMAMNLSDTRAEMRADVRELRQTAQLQQAYIDKLLSLARKQP